MSTLQVFTAIVTAIVLEAAPFLLLGSFFSAFFEVYLPEGDIERYTPKGRVGQVLFGLFAGFLLPTCECGVVPITRRLLAKGVPSSTALAFMLSAPVVNPVVLASTWVAFRSNETMVALRVAMVLIPAALVAWLLGGRPPGELLRLPKNLGLAPAPGAHEPGCACGCGTLAATRGGKLRTLVALAGAEFAEMGKYLILGAVAAGVFKTFLPGAVLGSLAGNLPLAVAAMMLLAVLLSVCSEADAFVAASFASFPAAARLSFVALGPMVDLKLAVAYLAVFRTRPAAVIMIVPAAVIYVLALLVGQGGL